MEDLRRKIDNITAIVGSTLRLRDLTAGRCLGYNIIDEDTVFDDSENLGEVVTVHKAADHPVLRVAMLRSV